MSVAYKTPHCCFILSARTSLGYYSHFTDDKTDSESTELGFELGSAWLKTPSFTELILLQLLKDGLALLGPPTTSWPPTF